MLERSMIITIPIRLIANIIKNRSAKLPEESVQAVPSNACVYMDLILEQLAISYVDLKIKLVPIECKGKYDFIDTPQSIQKDTQAIVNDSDSLNYWIYIRPTLIINFVNANPIHFSEELISGINTIPKIIFVLVQLNDGIIRCAILNNVFNRKGCIERYGQNSLVRKSCTYIRSYTLVICKCSENQVITCDTSFLKYIHQRSSRTTLQ
jgi:hypothetical protein